MRLVECTPTPLVQIELLEKLLVRAFHLFSLSFRFLETVLQRLEFFLHIYNLLLELGLSCRLLCLRLYSI